MPTEKTLEAFRVKYERQERTLSVQLVSIVLAILANVFIQRKELEVRKSEKRR